jgi:hypothetical protein
MKTLIIFVSLSLGVFGCEMSSNYAEPNTRSDDFDQNVTSRFVNCKQAKFSHKSESVLSAMNALQLINEEVDEQIYHQTDLADDYSKLVGRYIRKQRDQILPVLIRYIDEYDPNRADDCDDPAGARFSVASAELSDFDNNVARLRAGIEGRAAIESLERAVAKMKVAGFARINHEQNSRFSIASLNVEMMKGTNITDEMIRATLQARYKIQMTETEYLEFSNFLVSLDPTYPTWSEVGDYGPPQLVKDSQRYHEAYLKFRAKK